MSSTLKVIPGFKGPIYLRKGDRLEFSDSSSHHFRASASGVYEVRDDHISYQYSIDGSGRISVHDPYWRDSLNGQRSPRKLRRLKKLMKKRLEIDRTILRLGVTGGL